MKLKEIIQKVIKSKEFKDDVDLSTLGEKEFNLFNIPWIEQDILTSYWYGKWYCTDTFVGYKVYFFENKPVAISKRLFRKSDETFYWISKEDHKKVFEYLISFIKEEESPFDLCDLELEMGETYKIEYISQLFNHHLTNCLYQNQPVTILKKHKDKLSLVKIKSPDELTQWIELKELDFPYNLTDKPQTSIPEDRWVGHEHHCCVHHGCKYGYDDCPVVLELIKQKYPCEFCRDTDIQGCFVETK